MKIYLIRHTSVDVPKGICYGQTDVALNVSFEEEAAKVKTDLGHIKPDVGFSSPLSRCTQLARFCKVENVILDNRLKELDFGDWEGKEWNNIDLSVWKTDWINSSVPNGESFIKMYERVASFFDQLRKENYDTAIVFTHGGVINCARVYFRKTELLNAFAWIPKYGEIVEFDL
ncbi:MAG: alpha-ribazole phosphatase [Massilibacteroides sp.]|nr:alpha-ribazole phosphatase [Massilibacteroides sp.]MDD3061417.1 alpha-ribazole phosphatase [Massilibacteroides sp.]MDD4115615.1 alpha-ribazole phosphatase [Massilibacteroides sp.]MDD4661510.1 alpha-ribazole phosphatase [Massilibacteroides sp.]